MHILFALAMLADPVDVSQETVPQLAVSYSDLDLTTEDGRRELSHRVEKAAQQVCRSYPRRVEAYPYVLRGCYTTALIEGRRQATMAVAQARGAAESKAMFAAIEMRALIAAKD